MLFTVWGQTQGTAVLSLDSGRWDLVLPARGFAVGTFEATGGSKGRILLVDQIRRHQSRAVRRRAPRAHQRRCVGPHRRVLRRGKRKPWLAGGLDIPARPCTPPATRHEHRWCGSTGKERSNRSSRTRMLYREVSLSPDGLKAVVRHELDLWIHDLQRGTRIRLTSGTGSNILSGVEPRRRADPLRVQSRRRLGHLLATCRRIAARRSPAQTALRPVPATRCCRTAPCCTTEIHPKTARDLWTLSPDGKTSPLRVTPFNETSGQFSPGPDGGPRWVAYASDESGRSEIYVQSYPSGANRIPVSTGGGILPKWSRDGKELFYVTGDAVVAVAMRPDGSVGAPRRLFDRSSFLVNPSVPQLQCVAGRQTVPDDSARSGVGAASAQRDSQLV